MQLEGKITGPWVEVVSHTWHSLEPVRGSKELRLDLRSVGFVDAEGRQLLRAIYQQSHAQFLADSPLTEYFANDARQISSSDVQEGA
jgi:hypothetical protein